MQPTSEARRWNTTVQPDVTTNRRPVNHEKAAAPKAGPARLAARLWSVHVYGRRDRLAKRHNNTLFSGETETERIVTDVNLGVLSTTITCYNKNFSSCPTTVFPLPSGWPVTQTDVYTYPGDTTTNPSLVETLFDSYGNTTQVSRYDFGAAYPPSGSPISKTTILYDSAGWLAHLYVFCKGGDSCSLRRAFHLHLAPLIDSHRALFSASVTPIAAPRPRLRFLHQASHYRIKVHIA